MLKKTRMTLTKFGVKRWHSWHVDHFGGNPDPVMLGRVSLLGLQFGAV